MIEALYLNGVWESVLEEILKAQARHPKIVCYLQPHKSHVIQKLKDAKPSQDEPYQVYMSATDKLDLVTYIAEIVAWDDKREVQEDIARLQELNAHIEKYQPEEGSIYPHVGDDPSQLCVNLISIRNLRRLPNPFPVRSLKKTSDGTSVKPRSRSGGWSYVHAIPDWVDIEEVVHNEIEQADLERRLLEAGSLTKELRSQRLELAQKKPERVQIISSGFRRNADVIITQPFSHFGETAWGKPNTA